MIRLKRFFILKKEKEFGECKAPPPASVKEYINNEVDFLRSVDHEDMENIVKGNVEPTKEFNGLGFLCFLDQESKDYLKKLNDSTILTTEKDIISEFSSQIVMEEISVKSIETLNI